MSAIGMSALCQKRTLRTHLGASETIVIFSSTGAAGGAEIPLVSSKDAIGRERRQSALVSVRTMSVCLIRNALSVRSVKAVLPSPFYPARMETQGRYSCWDTIVGSY